MSEHQTTVFVIDDDDAFRDSVEVLCSSVDLATEGFADAQSFLDAYSEDWTGCIVLDIRMPGMSGLELQVALRRLHCAIPIIFVTGHGDIEMAVSALKNGAYDFLTKPFRQQDLLDRIHLALRAADQKRVLDQAQHAVEERFARLTPREREVFDLVVQGCANKVVAGRLDISQRTVELHRSQVMQKMEAESLADLVRLSIRLEEASG